MCKNKEKLKELFEVNFWLTSSEQSKIGTVETDVQKLKFKLKAL